MSEFISEFNIPIPVNVADTEFVNIIDENNNKINIDFKFCVFINKHLLIFIDMLYIDIDSVYINVG